jgi:hypothetical protein
VTYVAALLALALIAASGIFASVIRSMVRQQARERQLLLDQILHLSGRTWTPPPVEQWEPPVEPVDEGRYVMSGSETVEDF